MNESIKRTGQEFFCDFCGHLSGDHSPRMSDSERAPCFKCGCEWTEAQKYAHIRKMEQRNQQLDLDALEMIAKVEIVDPVDYMRAVRPTLLALIQRLREAESDNWELLEIKRKHQVAIEQLNQHIAALERAGQELWALFVKYGLKHRPLCVMTAKPDGNECSCGLAEETYAVMDRLRLTENAAVHKAGSQ